MKQHRGVQRHASPTSKYQFFENTVDDTTHMVFECQPAVKLHNKNIEVLTCANGNPDKTKSQWGGFTVLDLLTTKALVLLGFSIMQQ